MSDLVEFLLARIAEDARREIHFDDCDYLTGPGGPDDDSACTCRGETRWLAECDAKRRIVSLFVESAEHHQCSPDELFSAPGVLRLLALPYAAHPDYDESWRP